MTEDVVTAALMRDADQLLRVIDGHPIPGQQAEELVVWTVGVRGGCCKQCRGDGGKKATGKPTTMVECDSRQTAGRSTFFTDGRLFVTIHQ